MRLNKWRAQMADKVDSTANVAVTLARHIQWQWQVEGFAADIPRTVQDVLTLAKAAISPMRFDYEADREAVTHLCAVRLMAFYNVK
jgi:hypothetical protein